jgi:RimJ/RimL family protein N-acetyltransferase
MNDDRSICSALETERLLLRPLVPEDFCAVHTWAVNPKNTRFMAWGPNTERDTQKFLEFVKIGSDFAVTLRESGKVIGSCGIYPDAARDTGELGWILHKDHWNRGYGTELAGTLIRYGFEQLKLRRIFARCAAGNIGSRRVMEHSGMRCEALHIKTFWARVDKEWIDEAVYAILSDEYMNKPRIRLYVPREDELSYRRSLISDEETMSFNSGCGDAGTGAYRTSPEQCLRWWDYWKSAGNFYAYVVRISDQTPVGEVNIHFSEGFPREQGVGWIGVIIEAKQRGRGYGTQALKALVDHAFQTMGLVRLLDDVPVIDAGTVRMFERAGFSRNENGLMEIENKSVLLSANESSAEKPNKRK